MNFFADNNHNKSQQKLNNKPDECVKLWERRQEKQSIRDKSVSHQCEKSIHMRNRAIFSQGVRQRAQGEESIKAWI